MKHTKEAVEKYRAQVSSVTDTFVAFIESLEKRGASGINGRLHSFIGRSLDFNGLGIDTSLVERLFIAVARCNPFSVSFSNASLTDKHLIAMGKMISENPSLLHYNLDGTVLVSLESWNYLQKLTSSSALIVSLPLPRTKGADVTTYLNIQEPVLESTVKKEKIDCWCCKEIRYDLLLKQPMEKVSAMFTSTKESETSTDVVCEAIRTELCEHRLLPYNKVFSQLFGVDPKKLRLLRDMMQEEEFTSIFAQKIEQEKEAAFTRFKTNIKAKAQEENLSISGMDINTSVVLDYNEIWKIDEGWDEASINGSLNQTKASFTLPNNL
jgi:hypothetical protein